MRGRRARHPKIARLLGDPRAAVARRQIETARSLQIAPTLYLELRLPKVTYLYEDDEHPERCTGSRTSPAYTHEDRALLMGLEAYEQSLCKCGYPVDVAWHSDMDGWFESDGVVCHACSARAGREIAYAGLRNTRDMDANPLPPFVPGKTITAPS